MQSPDAQTSVSTVTTTTQTPDAPLPRPYLTGILIVICSAFFLAIWFDRQSGSDEWAALEHLGFRSGFAIWDGAYWAIPIPTVLHLEFWHLAFNLYWLWTFGTLLERAIGARPLLIVVLLSTWVTSLAELAASDGASIGMSGVVYALFGMAIPLRSCHATIKAGLTVKVIVLFLVWLVGCLIATFVAKAPIGNAAHATGLLCGLLVGFRFRAEHLQRPATAALAVLVTATSLTLAWCPWSPTWAGVQGVHAYRAKDYPAAIIWYLRSIELGGDQAWAWECVADVHVATGDRDSFLLAIAKLHAIDAKAADDLERQYGDSFRQQPTQTPAGSASTAQPRDGAAAP